MSSQIVKGFNEYVGAEAAKRDKIRKIIEREFGLYGFEIAESPIVEREDFVIGDDTGDDAVRDVFRLSDRGQRKLALRFEFTFQLKRLAKNQKLPFKRFQIGSVFRDEPIRKGRTREFTQCDADVVGSGVKDEVEILKMISGIFDKLGMKVKIYINNRKLINEILVSENIEEKFREQVIREIDKLDKLSRKEVADNLKKIGCERVLNVFVEGNFKKYKFYSEILELKKLCGEYGVEVEFRPFLARGLSYYNGTVFEVWSDELGVSLCGGGAYLINEIQSFGMALGFEPIYLLSDIKGDRIEAMVLSIECDKEAIELTERLRKVGIRTLLMTDKTIGKAMEYADSKNIEKVIFVGKKEVAEKKFKIRNMNSGNEKFLNLNEILQNK